MVGIIITTFNDCNEFVEMFSSLSNCTGFNSENIVVIDGSNDDNKTNIIKACEVINIKYLDYREHLTQALNLGTTYLVNEKKVDYVLWLHTDMRFERQANWIEALVGFMKDNPKVGKCSPRNWNLENIDAPDSPGNQCPTMITKEVVDLMLDKYGELYDENYWGACCWDDDDFNRKIYGVGKEVWITNRAIVWHKGMGTRGMFKRYQWELHNTQYHISKWGEAKMYV